MCYPPIIPAAKQPYHPFYPKIHLRILDNVFESWDSVSGTSLATMKLQLNDFRFGNK